MTANNRMIIVRFMPNIGMIIVRLSYDYCTIVVRLSPTYHDCCKYINSSFFSLIDIIKVYDLCDYRTMFVSVFTTILRPPTTIRIGNKFLYMHKNLFPVKFGPPIYCRGPIPPYECQRLSCDKIPIITDLVG